MHTKFYKYIMTIIIAVNHIMRLYKILILVEHADETERGHLKPKGFKLVQQVAFAAKKINYSSWT